MTALPVRVPIPPEQALLFIEEARERFAIVTLTADDYFSTIKRTVAQDFVSGRVYDALLLRCAAKVKAEIIYTWNLKHFRAISPELAERMRTP